MDLERCLPGNGWLFVVFDLEDLDRDSVVGFGDFDVQLLWWCLDPVIATSATVLAFVECLDSCAGSEVLKILELVLLGWAILMCGESRDVRRGTFDCVA